MARLQVPAELSLAETFVVRPDETVAERVDLRLPRVLATFVLVERLEVAAGRMLQPHLPDGWTTVGTRLLIDHSAAATEGAEVTVTCEVTGQEGRSFSIDVVGADEFGTICVAQHTRMALDIELFSRLNARRAGARDIVGERADD